MRNLPFMRPNVVKKESYLHYLDQIDETRIYSNYGPLVETFERRVLEECFLGDGAVSTVSNATLGLMVAISETKRSTGRYAIMPSFTFSATPLAAMWCGLTPYFIDISPDDWCMNEVLLRETLERLGDEVAVVVPYATFGTAMDLSYYTELHRAGIPVVVDAAASFGTVTDEPGYYGKGFPGMIVYSFHATKSFGVGEGGLIYSCDEEAILKVRQSGNFGYYGSRESTTLGLNSKMTEYSAAIALATLDCFAQKVNKRDQLYRWYLEELEREGLLSVFQVQAVSGRVPAQFMSVLCERGFANRELISRVAEKGVQVNSYFAPACHQQQMFTSCPRTVLTVTEQVEQRILSLPLWEEMEKEDVEYVVQALRNSVSEMS